MATRPTTINPHTGQPMPAYLRPGTNPISGSLNDPFMEAQHNFAGPGPAALTAALRKQGLSFGNLAPSGRGRGPSLAASGLDPESARSIAVNDYLADLSGERAGAYAADQAAGAAASDRSTVQRAAAIANDPNTSAYGRPIMQDENGRLVTGDPTGQPPVNRQALAAQMAPGLIAPPAPEKVAAVTFEPPKQAIVNGKKTWVRAGSDGFIYNTARQKIDPAALQLPDDEKADYTLDGVRYSGATNKPIAGTATGASGSAPLSAGQRDELATMDTVQSMSKKLMTLGDEIGWSGTGGMGYGSAAEFLAKNFGAGSEKAQQLRSYIGQVKGTVAKLRGGTAFSASEEKLLDSYVPGIDDSPMVIKTKVKALDDFIESKRKATTGGPGALTAGAAPPAGGDGTIEMVTPDGRSIYVPAGDVEAARGLGAKPKGGR